jgi:hypothetical protein
VNKYPLKNMNKKLQTSIATIGTAAIVFAGAAIPAFAATVGISASAQLNASTSVTAQARIASVITNVTARADQEITRRISALNTLSTRVNAMEKLSATEKTNLSANIQTELNAMTNLQTQIAADASANNTTTLKTDVDSITSSYRIFALIIPQGDIEAAADRVLTTASIFTDLSTKFSTRISAAQTAGNNVTAATAALTDMNAKVSDANTQSQAAASEVSSLTPDNGNATIMASNTATLKDAKTKIIASQQDLIAAGVDAQNIIKALATFKVSASVTATSSL